MTSLPRWWHALSIQGTPRFASAVRGLRSCSWLVIWERNYKFLVPLGTRSSSSVLLNLVEIAGRRSFKSSHLMWPVPLWRSALTFLDNFVEILNLGTWAYNFFLTLVSLVHPSYSPEFIMSPSLSASSSCHLTHLITIKEVLDNEGKLSLYVLSKYFVKGKRKQPNPVLLRCQPCELSWRVQLTLVVLV